MSRGAAGDLVPGLRVLELSRGPHYAIPYGTKLLADLGADVLVVEDGEGHALRRGHPNAVADPAVAEAVFAFLTGAKRCVTTRDGELVGRMAAWADVVVAEGAVLDGLDRGADVVLSIARASVVVRPWGPDGPYRDRPATALTLQAASGWVTGRKEVGLHPVQVGGSLDEWGAGAYVATAALTAHRAARTAGRPVSVDVSLMECLHSMLCYDRLRYDARGEMGVNRDLILLAPFGIRPCRDGFVGINTLTHQQWVDACTMTGLDEYAGSWAALSRGEGDLDAFGRRLEEYLADRCVADVVELGQAFRIPVVPVVSGDDLCGLAQWVERPFFVDAGSGAATYRQPGPPWRMHAGSGARAGS